MPTRYESRRDASNRLKLRRYIPLTTVIVFLLPLLFAGTRRALAHISHLNEVAPYRDGAVLIAFCDGTQPSQQDAILSSVGARETKRIGAGVHVLAVKSGQVLTAVNLLKAFSAVRYAEPDYLQTVSAGTTLPNDTSVGIQWAVHNTGQVVNGVTGTSGADERSLSAWGVTTGTNSVVVAVLDTGVQYSHPDLFTNMWNNPGGVGGCPAGSHGYNVLASTCDPMDDDTAYGGHGTHVAGILGAVGNNAQGTAGVNWTSSIMAVKWVDSQGNGATSDLITAMDWVLTAQQAGVNVHVVNDSQTWAGTPSSQALSDEIDLLGSNNILFVVASGNTAQNNDTTPRYPCSYARPTMICAAASDQNDKLWSSANYGPVSVQLAAPGVNIYSTLRSSNYGFISGGSMAAPQVAGTAALILSKGPQSVTNLRSLILNNVDVLSSLNGLVGTGGRLNVCAAIPGCASAIPGTLVSSDPPVVTSIPVQGGLLGASTGFWQGIPSTYNYQWNRCDKNGANCSPIPGAIGQSYAPLSSADVQATLAVTTTASNSFGSSSAQSSPSGLVAAATSAFGLTSNILDGSALSGTASWTITPQQAVQFVQFYIDGTLAGTESSAPYAFQSSGSAGMDTTQLANGTHVIGARALAADNRTYVFYGENINVANGPRNTTPPAVSGTAAPGQMLSTTNGVWTANPTSFTYAWEHCDSSGSNCSILSGPTNNTYTLSGADSGYTIRSAVTAYNSIGPVTASSAPTAVVSPVTGPVGYVRSAGKSGESAKYTVTISPTPGGFLAVAVWQVEGAVTPSAVTDNLGSVYTKDCDVTYNQGFGLRRLTVYHLKNVPSGITGVNITPNKPSRGIVAEYSGIPAGTVLDVCGAVNTQSSPITSWLSAATTTTTDDLVLGLADTGFTGTAGYSATGAWAGRLAQHDTVDQDDAYFEDQVAVAAGTYTATGKTTSSVAESSVVVAFKVTVGPVAPAITSASSATFTVGTTGTFTLTATGSPTPTLGESGPLPMGVGFNTSTGVLSGMPAAGTAGSYPITFTAQNGITPNAMQSFTLTVNPPPVAPTITSSNSATFTAGTAGTFTVTATGTPAPTFSETGALPSVVTLSAAGVLSGTPGANTGGPYPITITAQNGVTPNATQSFTLTVNQAPTITSANNTTFTIGTAGTFTVNATGFPAPTVSEAGTLPTGVTFNTSTRTLSGTPAAGTAGNYPITFSASNGIGSNATQSFTLTVDAVVIGTAAFVRSAGNFGESVKYTVSMAPAAGDFLAVFVWQVEGATTPSAMTDNLGSVYTKDCDVTYNQGFGLRRLTVYHLQNAPSGITGVSITPNRASRGIVAEYSGMPTTGTILDVCGAVNTQSSVSSWASSATTTSANDLIIGLADTGFAANAGYSASGTWAGRQAEHDTSDDDDAYFEDQVGVAAGSYTATGATIGSFGESAVVVAFKTGH